MKNTNRIASIVLVVLQFIRVAAMITCFVIFATWSTKSLDKLANKPIGSSVTFRNGDDKRGNMNYPILTWCMKNFPDMVEVPQFQSKCYDPSTYSLYKKKNWDWVLDYCFNHDKDPFLTLNESTRMLTTNAFGINSFNMPSVYNFLSNIASIEVMKLNSQKDKLFYSFFTKTFGLCHSLDLTYIGKNMLPPQDITFRFRNQFNANATTSTDFIAVIHEFPQDRIQALTSNPFSMSIGNEVTVRMQKQVLKAITSDESPCVDESGYTFHYCDLVKKEDIFFKKHDCKLPWMNQPLTPNDTKIDVNLCPIFDDLKNMTISDYAKDWQKIQNESLTDSCPHFPRCDRSFFQVTESTLYSEALAKDKVSRFVLRPVTSTVQYVVDSYTYDDQSFVGEVGGTLGLFLGYSFISVVDFFEYVCLKLLRKFKLL